MRTIKSRFSLPPHVGCLAGGEYLVHTSPVETKNTLGLVPVPTDVAVKGSLAGVLPLVSDQRGPRLHSLVADAALELRLLWVAIQ